MPKIFFQNHNTNFILPFQEKHLVQWIDKVIQSEGFHLSEVSYVFTNDEELNIINKNYLSHDNYTDIITFDYSEIESEIYGEILISIERVLENSTTYGVPFKDELARVMIHGVLHLLGYHDKKENQKSIMREKENACISLLQN